MSRARIRVAISRRLRRRDSDSEWSLKDAAPHERGGFLPGPQLTGDLHHGLQVLRHVR